MKIVHYSEEDGKVFQGDAVRGVTGRVMIGAADGAENFCMRVFTIEPGGFSPRHSHDWEHEIFFHQGQGAVWDGSGWTVVGPGVSVFIPGGAEHQVKNAGHETLVFVCLIPAGVPEI